MSALRGWLLIFGSRVLAFLFGRAILFLLTLWINKRALKRRVRSLMRAAWVSFGQIYRCIVLLVRRGEKATPKSVAAQQQTAAELT